ncbi:HECT-domain-containing protein [Atractiella rhizophila]|nr:HECT-domain-containing protein [Atractiella rhizophila]
MDVDDLRDVARGRWGRLGGAGFRRLKWGGKREVSSRGAKSVFSPRLAVLNNIPFVIPFELRVAIFREFVFLDQRRNNISDYTFLSGHRVTIRRNHVAEDGYAHLNTLGSALKGRIQIVFYDQFGNEEAGIDGGGLYKEFLTSLSKEAFDTNRGLWLETKEREVYPNPHRYAREDFQLSWYTFLGRMLGKALYDGILVDVNFANFFLAKWLGKQSHLDDLASLDPELYQGLIFLKNYDGDVEGDLVLNFTVSDIEFGETVTHELIPNGSNIPVTKENRLQYIYLTSHYRLNRQIDAQCSAFFAGLSDLIDNRWLQMFNQSELKILVGGVEGEEIDVDDLRNNTVYSGADGFDEAHETVRLFWSVVKRFSNEEKKNLIKFVTSCPRPPLLGFSELKPKFAIRANGNDTERLPTSSTCVNLLKLPLYKDEKQLKQKILYAINSNSGFGFS